MARILIAEDDSDMRGFLATALGRAGYEVEAVGDGETAQARLRAGPWHLLLADVIMPGMDGIALAQKCREIAPETQVMFITGFAAVALDHQKLADSGQDVTVLSKPFHLRDLVEKVDRLLSTEHARPDEASSPASRGDPGDAGA